MAQDKLLDVEIVTPLRAVFSGKAVSVTLPGSLSPFQVLYNHAPIVSSLDTGILKLTNEQNMNVYYATSSGFTEVSKNKVSVLVETAVESKDIDIGSEIKTLKLLKDELKSSSGKEIDEIKTKIIETENKIKAAQYSKAN